VTPAKNTGVKRHPLAVQKIATARTPHPTGSAYVPAAEKDRPRPKTPPVLQPKAPGLPVVGE
jgi:hypothetical protein